MPDGWLLWTTEDAGDEAVIGSGMRIHLLEQHGVAHAHRWPSWPIDEIASRIHAAAPTDRFPPMAAAVLEDVGWFRGRHCPMPRARPKPTLAPPVVVLAGEIDQYAVGRTVDEGIVTYATGSPPEPVD